MKQYAGLMFPTVRERWYKAGKTYIYLAMILLTKNSKYITVFVLCDREYLTIATKYRTF